MKNFGQEIQLKLYPLQKSVKGSSRVYQKPSVINVDPFKYIVFNDKSISNNFVTYDYQSYNGNIIKICIAIVDTVFKIVADENGNGSLADDPFFTISDNTAKKDTFPEFAFHEDLRLPIRKFAVLPVDSDLKTLYSAKGVAVQDLLFSFISYDCLQTEEFLIGQDNYTIYLKKSLLLRADQTYKPENEGYVIYLLVKKGENANDKMVEFGAINKLMSGQFSKPQSMHILTISSIDVNKGKLIVFTKKAPGDFVQIDVKSLRAVSVNTGVTERIIISKKPVLFIFSGSWCKGCHEIKPKLDEFEKLNADKYDFVYVLKEKSLTAARKFATKSLYKSNAYYESFTDKAKTNLHTILQANAYPSVVIINHKGEVVFNEAGSNLTDKLFNFPL
jgi:thiol-disulfide isomerase/thioredoxin